MKSILLASASIVAFTIAGAAAADVDFTGSATLGFNDDDDDVADDHDGFYFDANVAVILSQELDNGITVTAEFDFDAVNVEGRVRFGIAEALRLLQHRLVGAAGRRHLG